MPVISIQNQLFVLENIMGQIKVLVIGAGAAGLCAAKYLSSNANFTFEVFERYDSVGGMWVYSEETHDDEYGLPVHSSIYKHMRTNIPVEIMPFIDFPFPPTEESYAHHSEVMRYLQSYADHYNLCKYIKFRKEVQDVSPILIENETKWKVMVKDLPTNNVEGHMFDAVMVCNGHFSELCIPPIPGMEDFKGIVMHSHDYRVPESFEGKKVVLWGASTSAFDIAKEICFLAENVVICHRVKKKLPKGFPRNIQFSANIKSAYEGGFHLENGTTCEADAFIYCTGYLFSFPFLNKDCKIQVNDNHVTPLYKHLINIEYPTMCLVGVPLFTIPFILYDYQVAFFLKTLDKSVRLPSKEEMQLEADKEFQWRCTHNIPARYAHLMNFMLWEYLDELATAAELERLPPVVKNILEDSIASSKREIAEYKMYKYEIIDQENFRKSKLDVLSTI